MVVLEIIGTKWGRASYVKCPKRNLSMLSFSYDLHSLQQTRKLPAAGQMKMLKGRNYFSHIQWLVILWVHNHRKEFDYHYLLLTNTDWFLVLPLFLLIQQASPGSQLLIGKTNSTKMKGRKQAKSINKPQNLPRSSVHQSVASSSAPPTQFGLMGYPKIQTQSPPDVLKIPNQAMNRTATNISYNNHTPYHMFPTQPANPFLPMMYWSAPSAFPPAPYASSYGYQAFPSTANYISIHPQAYYSHSSCSPMIPKMAERNWKNDATLVGADSDSDSSSSSSTEPKEALPSCK